MYASHMSGNTGGERLATIDVCVLALSGALLATLVENGTYTVQRLFLHRLSHATTGFLWTVPVSYTVAFGLLALGLLAVTRVIATKTAIQLTVTLCGTLVMFVALLLALYGRVHQWTLVILSLGVGVQLGRMAARRPSAVVRWARVFVLLAGVLVLVPAAGNPPLQRWLERRESQRLPPARTGAPNVLLIILDTVRAASLSLYGNPRPTTPNFERLAPDGVVFEHAYSTAPWTLPSHASMFTGLYPHQLTTDWVIPLRGKSPTLAEAFRGAGYRSAGIVANLFYCTEEGGLARGFIHYEDYLHTPSQIVRSTVLGQFFLTWRRKVKPSLRPFTRKSGHVINQQFLAWLDREPGRPFFAFLNYYDAHQAYLVPPDLQHRFQSGNPLEEQYEGAIASLDIEVSALIDSLKQRGLLQNTLVIITSDHGEHLGDHGLEGHGNSLYSSLLRVPLILFFGDRIPHGLRVNEPVSLRDLPRTVATLAGLEAKFPGQSLSRAWDPAAVPLGERSPLLSEVDRGIHTAPREPVTRGPMKSLFDDQLHFILNGDGKEELYAITTDPLEARDLSGSATASNDLMALRQLLHQALQATRGTGEMANWKGLLYEDELP